MNEVCPKCGLNSQLCVCEAIAKESQRVKVRLEKRRFGKMITVVEGIDTKSVNIKEVAKELKSKFACGGTIKHQMIELQGDHRNKVKDVLVNLGFSQDSIDVI
ncbi:stress response translation initiation inhibitor YciH [Candidatus Woesearchaeota archaeon]|nr:stress response translation initiation inhibitor YciH [Candidatus Woesearchaeota archaeon]